MESTTSKCVMVLDENLPLGLLANTAAILGITLGKHMPEAVGADVLDGSGKAHLGIIMFPVPILRGDAEQIRAIRETLYGVDYQAVIVVDFSDVAQCCKNYGEYIGNAAQADESEWRYFGLGLCGPKKLVSRLTGSMPLDRKSTRLNSSHQIISYAVFCLKKRTKSVGVNGGGKHDTKQCA